MYKLRPISYNAEPVMGITIPNEISLFFSGCFFSIMKSGCAIILTSGTNIQFTKEEIRDYNFSDIRI